VALYLYKFKISIGIFAYFELNSFSNKTNSQPVYDITTFYYRKAIGQQEYSWEYFSFNRE